MFTKLMNAFTGDWLSRRTPAITYIELEIHENTEMYNLEHWVSIITHMGTIYISYITSVHTIGK